MLNRIIANVVAILLCSVSVAFALDTYQVDPVHSTIGFKVRHLGVSYVSGKFDKIEGQMIFDGEKLTSLEGKVDVNSINTANEKRDGHLKSDDFFSADKFPSIELKSIKITQDGNTVAVVANLTIRDVTKIVEFQGEFGGFANMGKTKKAGLVLEGEINRQDFGLKFSKLLETGQAVVGDKVKISLELEGNIPEEVGKK